MFNKPKFWDFKKPNLISYLLLPFTVIIKINNLFLKFKLKKKDYKIKTICVGNLYLGGTGKTPTAIKVAQILKKLGFKVAIGKKFYFKQVDERILIQNKANLITENSRDKILIKGKKKGYNIIIFDDGLQDRYITYDFQIVCFDLHNWVGNGNLIPSGPLREKLSSLKKYDCVFLKSTNNYNPKIITLISKINPNIKIFESYYQIINLKKFNRSNKYLIFSGIGKPENFKKILVKNKFNIVDEIIYPDHFQYDENILDKIQEKAKKINAKIITTEKDFVKIPKKYHKKFEYISVDLIIKNEVKFINYLKSKIYE